MTSSPASFYQAEQKRALDQTEFWAARSRLLGNLRGVSFATAVLGALFYFTQDSLVAAGLSGLGLASFFTLVTRHGRVIEKEEHARRLALVNEHALLRSTGEFAQLPAKGPATLSAEHPYAHDLDLFGQGSLYQRLSVAHTHFGEQTLAQWLSEFASHEEILARQQAVAELAPQVAFRQNWEAEALALTEKRRGGQWELAPSPNPEPLLRWIETPPSLTQSKLLPALLFLLPALLLAGLGYHIWGSGTALHWVLPLLLNIGLLLRHQRVTNAAFAAVSTTQGAFLRYGKLLTFLEELPAESSWLRERKERIGQSSPTSARASQSMKRFERIVSWYDLRYNGMVYPFINAFFLWDLQCSLALERWKRDIGTQARDWFQVLGEMEALSSLSGLLSDDPGARFPVLSPDAHALEAEALGHPLLPPDRRVTNDFAPLHPGEALLITGSNMSGKSTFLRALGTNLVLAHAGAPVIAHKFIIPPCQLASSIRIADSLLTGTSHFYAEVKKLAAVVERSRSAPPVFFLLDEVLHGTNSRERQIGARWVLQELLKNQAWGILTTHDEGLCQLPAPLMEKVRQHHFREIVVEGKMSFDYQLRPGPVTSGNALRLMQQVGLNVPLEE